MLSSLHTSKYKEQVKRHIFENQSSFYHLLPFLLAPLIAISIHFNRENLNLVLM